MTPRALADLIDLEKYNENTDEPETSPAAVGFTPGVLVPGDQIHFYQGTSVRVRDGWYGGEEVFRGQTITVTQAILDLNKDRNGNSFLDLVDDEEAQVQKYGRRLLGRGPWPEDEPLIVPGTPEGDDERRRLLDIAKGISDPVAAKAERARIIAKFGHPNASTTIATYGGTR